MIGAVIMCLVVAASDADTVRCADGRRVRLAGISALERDGSCNSRPYCPAMRHKQAQPIAARLTLGRTIAFRVVGKSYDRDVGENKALRCALVQSGAAVEWPRYMRRYRLRGCGR
ncbi:hypothetical protein FJY63_01915 [Candidatus Sumerlaeota bacterium]|nr:hypothetical protein [Candidatus Sumerlaeota bacterium]